MLGFIPIIEMVSNATTTQCLHREDDSIALSDRTARSDLATIE
jgi:hypothetical protein